MKYIKLFENFKRNLQNIKNDILNSLSRCESMIDVDPSSSTFRMMIIGDGESKTFYGDDRIPKKLIRPKNGKYLIEILVSIRG